MRNLKLVATLSIKRSLFCQILVCAIAVLGSGAAPVVRAQPQGKAQAEITQQLEQLDQVAKEFIDDANRLLTEQQQLVFEIRRGARALEEGCKGTTQPERRLFNAATEMSPASAGVGATADAMGSVAERVREVQVRITSAEQAQCLPGARLKGANLETCGSLSIMGQWSNHAVRLLALRQQQLAERNRLVESVAQLEQKKCLSAGFSSKLAEEVRAQGMRLDQRTEQLLQGFLRNGAEIASRPPPARTTVP